MERDVPHNMDEAESDLIRRCQSGEKGAYEILVKRYAGRALGAATALLGDHADACDASQEAFVRAWRSIRRFHGRSSFYTWYSTILRNICVDHRRRVGRRPTSDLPEDHAQPEDCDPTVLAQRNERTEAIWHAVMALPPIHRDVIVMNHFQEMSYQQIAEALDVPMGTVTSRLYNARKALREKLGGVRP